MAQNRPAHSRYMPQGKAPSKDVKCVLHSVHVPEPLILEGHHVIPKGMQKETGVILPAFGEVVWVCPTGHANIHMRLARLLRGDTLLGRGGVTGRLALRAFYWYTDNIGTRDSSQPDDGSLRSVGTGDEEETSDILRPED